MEVPKIEMSNDTGTGEELWEGLEVEDKGKGEDKGKNTETDLVSDNTFNNIAC